MSDLENGNEAHLPHCHVQVLSRRIVSFSLDVWSARVTAIERCLQRFPFLLELSLTCFRRISLSFQQYRVALYRWMQRRRIGSAAAQ